MLCKQTPKIDHQFQYGQKLRLLREKLGYSQATIAECLGIDSQKYGALERNERLPEHVFFALRNVVAECFSTSPRLYEYIGNSNILPDRLPLYLDRNSITKKDAYRNTGINYLFNYLLGEYYIYIFNTGLPIGDQEGSKLFIGEEKLSLNEGSSSSAYAGFFCITKHAFCGIIQKNEEIRKISFSIHPREVPQRTYIGGMFNLEIGVDKKNNYIGIMSRVEMSKSHLEDIEADLKENNFSRMKKNLEISPFWKAKPCTFVSDTSSKHLQSKCVYYLIRNTYYGLLMSPGFSEEAYPYLGITKEVRNKRDMFKELFDMKKISLF